MKQLAKETYGDSHHFWYQAVMTQDHNYGQIFNSKTDLQQTIVANLSQDLIDYNKENSYFWYFGNDLDTINLMIRLKAGNFNIQTNLKDFDFALHIDVIEVWKNQLKHQLQTSLNPKR